MKKQRKHYTPEEKVAILRRHLVEGVPISDLCDESGLQPTVFYRWQKEFFENGAAAFQHRGRTNHQPEQERIAYLEKKVQRVSSAGIWTVSRQNRELCTIWSLGFHPAERSMTPSSFQKSFLPIFLGVHCPGSGGCPHMRFLVDHPILIFVVTVAVLWVSSRVGAALRIRRSDMVEEERGDYGVLLASMLTLLGLIIGFSFSMASSRYDQRKNLEEEEANAIGTEYVRADLLPADTAEKVRALLRSYLDQRILFYTTHSGDPLRQINATTAKLQAELWNTVKAPAGTDRSAVEALAVSGMNDVLNSQGYTQAAWWNRIPIGAWGLMWAIAVCCNVMIGFYIRPKDPKNIQFIMPIVIAVAFLLMADIDSPRRGIITVHPQNLLSLSDSLNPH